MISERFKMRDISLLGELCIFIVACFVISQYHPHWALPQVLVNGAYDGIIALGILPLLICGDIDLSCGAQMTFYAILCAMLLESGWALPLAIFTTLLAAVLIGCIQGGIIARGRLNSILVTIASSLFLSGINSILCKGGSIYNLPQQLHKLKLFHIGAFPVPAVLWLLVAAIMMWLLTRTYWGKFFYAVGNDLCTAEKMGIPIFQTKIVAFALSSICCFLCGIMYISMRGFVSPSIGDDVNYSVLTIAALGGVSFKGGRGKAHLVLCAGLLIGVMEVLLSVIGIPLYYQSCIKGLVLFFALFTNMSKS